MTRRRFVLAIVLLGALAAAGSLALLWVTTDDDAKAQRTTVAPAPPTELDRARELIRECRVRSTLSLHSGVFYLELKDGSRVDLPSGSEREVYAEIQRATPRCGPVTIAME